MDLKLLELKKILKSETFGKMQEADVEAPERPEKVLGEDKLKKNKTNSKM